MYGIEGERWLPETNVAWLAGYEGSQPVRIGNAATDQVQLDIFGEISDTLYAARQIGLGPIDQAGEFQTVLLEHLESIWQSPGRGIWEVRGAPRDFTHSRVMCWVAFDRAIRLAEQFGEPGPVDRWRGVREAIHADVCKHGFSVKRNSFTQYYGGETLDASLLLIPQVGFLPPDDPRVVGTIKAVEDNLLRDGFVMRYSTAAVDDGVGGTEGTFLACSFWLADAYTLSNRRKAATALFERLLSLRNSLGLLSEEYDTIGKRLLGNFPQGFSHLGLINTAHNLAHRRGPAHQRANRAAQEKVDDKDD